MTTKELIKAVAEKTDFTQKEIIAVMDAVEVEAKTMLATAEKPIKICDIALSTKATEARTGRNPATGEALDIPAGIKMTVKPSADWKRVLKGE